MVVRLVNLADTFGDYWFGMSIVSMGCRFGKDQSLFAACVIGYVGREGVGLNVWETLDVARQHARFVVRGEHVRGLGR